MSENTHITAPKVGDKWTREIILRQEDFNAFADVSGDDNPIHVDPDFSARTRFGKTVSHGMLLYSILWGMVKSAFPTAMQIQQEIKFPAPTFTDELVEFELKVKEIGDDGTINLSTIARTPSRDTRGLEGNTIISLTGGTNA